MIKICHNLKREYGTLRVMISKIPSFTHLNLRKHGCCLPNRAVSTPVHSLLLPSCPLTEPKTHAGLLLAKVSCERQWKGQHGDDPAPWRGRFIAEETAVSLRVNNGGSTERWSSRDKRFLFPRPPFSYHWEVPSWRTDNEDRYLLRERNECATEGESGTYAEQKG